MASPEMTNTLSPYVKQLFPQDQNKTTATIKEQAQIPVIFDVLGRKNQHHLLIQGSSSQIFNHAFLETVAPHFADENTPKTLRDCYFFHLDAQQLFLSHNDTEALAKDFSAFCSQLKSHYKCIVLAISNAQILLLKEAKQSHELMREVTAILQDPPCRVMLLTQHSQDFTHLLQSHLKSFLTPLKLKEPSTSDSISVLKSLRDDIENYHHIIIPDESFPYALMMANHYLSGSASTLDKAFQLLDSAAARVSALERNDQSGHSPILTTAIVAQTVSSWTHIPLTHLQHNKFKAAEFVQGMQKNIFGQDAAINHIGLALQYARLKLQQKTGPLCTFLFAGPSSVGKTETAYALAEYLFGHTSALLRINLDKILRPSSLAEIKVSIGNENGSVLSLLDAIHQIPYAVILLDNINQAAPGTIDLFHEIFSSGYCTDSMGVKHDFRHSIFILTTTLGSERILNMMQTQNPNEASQATDLMQLILNDHPQESLDQPRHTLSPHELTEEMIPSLQAYFSPNILRHFNIVPFIYLDYASIEKIVRLKLKLLAQQIDTNYSIELSYAAEIIRFLVQEMMWRNDITRSIDKVLEQHLYSCIAHELISRLDDKNKPKRLLLQLNDAGQLLRCEFVSPSDATLYKL